MPSVAPSVAHLTPRLLDGTAPRGLFGDHEYARPRAFFTTHDTPTPLVDLPGLAAGLALGGLWLKDETARFGLPAFKSLGVEFAVDALRQRGALAAGQKLVCASAGNHGRAVARAARNAGLPATIFLDAAVAASRVDAIASEGATIVRVDGTYDDAVREAAAHAARTGAQVVSDTSWPGYEQVPRDIMLGYTRLMDEAESAWESARPDVLVVQAGVGGLLAAVASWSAHRYGHDRPVLLAVEPVHAACVQRSARAGRPALVTGSLATVMAGLRCGEVSPLAFSTLADTVDGYLAIDDSWTRLAMRTLAHASANDPRLDVGASGAAGVAALLALRDDPALAGIAAALGLGPTERVMVIATEGVTEPDIWGEATGLAHSG